MDFNFDSNPNMTGKENSDRLWQSCTKAIFNKNLMNYKFKDEKAHKMLLAMRENIIIDDYINKARLIGLPVQGHGKNPEF